MNHQRHWFVLRDLKRRNSKSLAIHDLMKDGLEVFSPMKQMVMTIAGKRTRREVPIIQDLLFVHETKEVLDRVVENYPNLQFRYQRGCTKDNPMTVREDDMKRFINAVSNTKSAIYYSPGELKESMLGRDVRIIGGILDGYEGRLLSIKGMRKKRLVIELSGFVTAAIEVDPEFIQIL